MPAHPPNLSLPPERNDSPTDLGRVLAIVAAVAWLLVGVSIMLLVGGAWFVAELLDVEATGQLDSRAVVIVGSIAVSLMAFRLAWLLLDAPKVRTWLISLVAAVALLGIVIAVQLSQGQIESGPDLLLAGFVVLVSGLGVWQRR